MTKRELVVLHPHTGETVVSVFVPDGLALEEVESMVMPKAFDVATAMLAAAGVEIFDEGLDSKIIEERTYEAPIASDPIGLGLSPRR